MGARPLVLFACILPSCQIQEGNNLHVLAFFSIPYQWKIISFVKYILKCSSLQKLKHLALAYPITFPENLYHMLFQPSFYFLSFALFQLRKCTFWLPSWFALKSFRIMASNGSNPPTDIYFPFSLWNSPLTRKPLSWTCLQNPSCSSHSTMFIATNSDQHNIAAVSIHTYNNAVYLQPVQQRQLNAFSWPLDLALQCILKNPVYQQCWTFLKGSCVFSFLFWIRMQVNTIERF